MSSNACSGAGFKRVTVKFTGRVQGVGFRYTTRSLAREWEVTGFVRNEPDGSVTLVAEGTEDAVKGLLDSMHASHLGRCIRDEHAAWGPVTGQFDTFEIRHF